jgi:hypothetical protein
VARRFQLPIMTLNGSEPFMPLAHHFVLATADMIDRTPETTGKTSVVLTPSAID